MSPIVPGGRTDEEPEVNDSESQIPDATIARLVTYRGLLTHLASSGVTTVSSHELAEAAGANPAQLRKDLSHLGSYGVRGVGYDVAYLQVQLDQHLGAGPDLPMIIVGVGNLGQALANHRAFSSRGFRVVGLVDADPLQTGELVEGLAIVHDSELEALIARTGAIIAVLTTPGQVAQQMADRLVASGIVGILNFAPAALAVPPHVTVRKVDLGSELQILAYHCQVPDRSENPILQSWNDRTDVPVPDTGVPVRRDNQTDIPARRDNELAGADPL